MIVDERDRSDRLLIRIPLLPHQIVPDQIPQCFRPVRVLLPRNMPVEIVEKVMVERNAESNEFFHILECYHCKNSSTKVALIRGGVN